MCSIAPLSRASYGAMAMPESMATAQQQAQTLRIMGRPQRQFKEAMQGKMMSMGVEGKGRANGDGCKGIPLPTIS